MASGPFSRPGPREGAAEAKGREQPLRRRDLLLLRARQSHCLSAAAVAGPLAQRPAEVDVAGVPRGAELRCGGQTPATRVAPPTVGRAEILADEEHGLVVRLRHRELPGPG